MSMLERILETKKREIAEAKEQVSLADLQAQVRRQEYQPKTVEWREDLSLIAELKRRSPSRGEIYQRFQVTELTRRFSSAKVLSVLTDREFFGGSREIWEQVRSLTRQPLLRKDFIIDEYQVWQTRAWQADVMLLIVRAVSREQLDWLWGMAESLGLQVLVETHTVAEIEIVTELLPRHSREQTWVGINSRDLDTFTVDLERAVKLSKKLPEGVVLIAESGVFTTQDLEYLRQNSFEGVLIGEGLAKNPDLLDFFRG